MDTNVPSFASIGIDIGKEVFHIVGFSTDGRIAFRRKIKRLALVEIFKKLPSQKGLAKFRWIVTASLSQTLSARLSPRKSNPVGGIQAGRI